MKMIIEIIILMILCSAFVLAEQIVLGSEIIEVDDDTILYLGNPTLFCNRVGCSIRGNLLVMGNVTFNSSTINITVINYNITGSMTATGNISASNFFGNVNDTSKVEKSGDTMTGDLNMSNNIIFDVNNISTNSNDEMIFKLYNGTDIISTKFIMNSSRPTNLGQPEIQYHVLHFIDGSPRASTTIQTPYRYIFDNDVEMGRSHPLIFGTDDNPPYTSLAGIEFSPWGSGLGTLSIGANAKGDDRMCGTISFMDSRDMGIINKRIPSDCSTDMRYRFYGDNEILTNNYMQMLYENLTNRMIIGGGSNLKGFVFEKNINMTLKNITEIDNLDANGITSTGVLNVSVYNTGDVPLGHIEAYFGNNYGAIEIGDTQIIQTNLTIGGMNLNGSTIIRNTESNSNIEFIFATTNDLARFAIPVEGVDFAVYNPRSMMVGGDLGQSFDDGIINCTAQGYTNIDCDTAGTGADLGVQDDLEVRGNIYGNVSEVVGEHWVNESGDVVEWLNVSGNLTAGNTGSNHRLYTAEKGQAGEAYLGVTNWNILNLFNTPELYGIMEGGGAFRRLAVRNALYIRGVNENPSILFTNNAALLSSTITYKSPIDVLAFALASGGYTFDNSVYVNTGNMVVDSDAGGLILGEDADYKIISDGTTTTFNSAGNDVDTNFINFNDDSMLFMESGTRMVGIRNTNPNSALDVIGVSRFGDSVADVTLINSIGTISQLGSAKASFNELTMNSGEKLYFRSGHNASITHDGTNMLFTCNETNNGICYFTSNISVENLIDRSWYWDENLGNALDYIKDSNELKTDEDLPDFEKTTYPITDKDRPVITTKEYENCTTTYIDAIYDPENESIILINASEYEECNTIFRNKTTYPYKLNETGRVISVSIGKHEQAIYELNEKIKDLERRIIELEK